MTLQERLREAGYTIYLEAADELDRLERKNEALRAALVEMVGARRDRIALAELKGKAWDEAHVKWLERDLAAAAAAIDAAMKEQKP
jgi:hypothetical protein